jgi:hypothetical protein
MKEQLIFEEKELKRLGLVCSICNTESIFDLGKDQTANSSRECPGCGADFLKSFSLQGKLSNWVTYYKAALDAPKNVRIRFYFD